jgi:hypothetical protein
VEDNDPGPIEELIIRSEEREEAAYILDEICLRWQHGNSYEQAATFLAYHLAQIRLNHGISVENYQSQINVLRQAILALQKEVL